MVKYTVSMLIRMVCIVAMVFVRGWWLILFAAGAIFLPYFAVIIANQVSIRGHARHVSPTETAVAPRVRVSAEDWAAADRSDDRPAE